MTRLVSLVLVVRYLEHALAVYERALGFARVGEASDVPSLGARHVFLRAQNCLFERGPGVREMAPTAGLGLEVEAPSLPLLFERAGLGMLGLMIDLAAVEPRARVAIALAAEDREALLRDWLQHLLVRLQAGPFALSELAVEEVNERALRAWGAGERVDRARHRLYTEVKGVTYHQLALCETAGGWWARIILDV